MFVFCKQYLLAIVFLILFIFSKANFAKNLVNQNQEIRLGVISGAHEKIAKIVSDVAVKDGLHIKIVPFSDFFQPNAALQDGSLDANSFQHQAYLNYQVKTLGYDIVSVAKTFNFPMGIYSKTVNSLNNLKKGSKIAIPNDPSNGGRALLLLQAHSLIKLKDVNKIDASPLDITENPRKLHFEELDAAQLPRALFDVDAAVINTDYALLIGLNPLRDAIVYEPPNSPYVNVIAVKGKDKNKHWVHLLIKAYKSLEVQKFIDSEFNGSVIFENH